MSPHFPYSQEEYFMADTLIYTCPMHPEIKQQDPGKCPECGMPLKPAQPLGKGQGDYPQFGAIAPLPEVPAGKPQAARSGYTCPMHPEINQPGPGSCPKCGMALEPVNAGGEEENTELKDMTRRFWVSAAITAPLFILAMTADLRPSWLPAGLSMKTVQWAEFTLATPVVLWGGWPFFVKAWRSVLTWNLNMFTLIGMGVSVAWLYSIAALLLPRLFPPVMRLEGEAERQGFKY
ncbi:MAG: hypothetical protein AUJ51_08385 [Elusimicrobia bacterium CG1_02_56_21]|nr:MAG: hypothetical protein AUJ51_08385 [Elusimicrobia bacterium CG1_02_56_21]